MLLEIFFVKWDLLSVYQTLALWLKGPLAIFQFFIFEVYN